ncbi:RING finger and transmembrane domain-containing protein 2 [Anopheles bellator]|uniref:RING finger and transmembrane domain-containing protein 2 n=1 Tax=Anopheles bellator TaxID=139047 RepID=UPI002648C659|nr:RING finger and transmembrane domain-containing protein 2 [Anopheles bellator]
MSDTNPTADHNRQQTAGPEKEEAQKQQPSPVEVDRKSTAADRPVNSGALTETNNLPATSTPQTNPSASEQLLFCSPAADSTNVVLNPQTSTTSAIERQTSVGSIDSATMPSATGGGSGTAGGSGFRSSISNGRVSFSRFISVDRSRSGNETSNGRSSNFSNDVFSDFLTLVQQARHPSSFFSGERRTFFNQTSSSGRSHAPGTSTPPSANSANSASEVVIDVDGGSAVGGGTSLRSSQNELYPMSTSSSTGIRPFMWMQQTEESAPTSAPTNGGRSPLMPNFNYSHHHHHHHFHNHQPLSLHQHSQPLAGMTMGGAQQSPLSASVDGGTSSAVGDQQQHQHSGGGVAAISTPTGANLPPFGGGGGTRSNSVSSNHLNDEATVHEALNQIPEARVMMDTLARYTPLLLILVAKLCYDHLDGIIYFLMLLITFYHANWVVRQEISKQKQRRIIVLLREMLVIVVTLMIFGLVFEFENIWLVLLFMPISLQPQSLKSLLFSVCITDLILKQITIVIKIIFTLMPPSLVDYKSRGKIYLMIESLSQLYRAAAPIQPWLIFLFESYSGSEKMVGVILSAVYIVAKSTDLLDRVKFCRRSLIKLMQKTSYGTVPTKEQLQTCGGQCSICHDNFNSPVLLECNHIFCELCVGTWFDREQTCPLCRARIVDDPSYRDGATTFFLQLY